MQEEQGLLSACSYFDLAERKKGLLGTAGFEVIEIQCSPFVGIALGRFRFVSSSTPSGHQAEGIVFAELLQSVLPECSEYMSVSRLCLTGRSSGIHRMHLTLENPTLLLAP